MYRPILTYPRMSDSTLFACRHRRLCLLSARGGGIAFAVAWGDKAMRLFASLLWTLVIFAVTSCTTTADIRVDTQLNSTSFTDAGVRHISVRIYVTYYIKTKYISHISYSDLSPILVRLAVKSYFTSWFAQNLSIACLEQVDSVNINDMIC